jgi:hypothetical protein
MTNSEKSLLRATALDPDGVSAKRLDALDKLAASENIYCTRHYACETYIKPGSRSVRFVKHGLRALLKTKRFITPQTKAAVRERILFLATGESLKDSCNRRWLGRVSESGEDHEQSQPEQPASPIVLEIEETLRKYRAKEEKNAIQSL